MADFDVVSNIIFNGGSLSGAQFSFGSAARIPVPGSVVTDEDGSGTASAGDTWDTFTYSGFTMEIAGKTYAVYNNGGDYRIPNGGELFIQDLPASPVTVTFDNNAVVANCLLEGTEILTPDGVVPIEVVKPGDLVCSPDNTPIEVKWVWRQTIFTRFGMPEQLMPVRVAAGALGDDLPFRDLTLTADHGLLVDGLLINAGVLVNGTTIDWVPLTTRSSLPMGQHPRPMST